MNISTKQKEASPQKVAAKRVLPPLTDAQKKFLHEHVTVESEGNPTFYASLGLKMPTDEEAAYNDLYFLEQQDKWSEWASDIVKDPATGEDLVFDNADDLCRWLKCDTD